MAGGEGDQIPLDMQDQAAIHHAFNNGGNLFQNMAESAQIMQHAAMKAQLAQSMSAGTTMRVDPAQVDKLAAFFEDEAEAMQKRQRDVFRLGKVKAPGHDPVSTQAADTYGKVGSGDANAYSENYMKLAQVFRDTAANLRANAQQTRTDDQNAEDGFRGGNLA